MSSTTARGIQYPTSGDNIAPLETVFATLASTTNTAMGNLSATDIASGTLPITRGGTGAVTADTALVSLGAMPAGSESAGKNYLLNSDFSIWQRATSFANPADGMFTADRWSVAYNGTGATRTVSRQAFTPGTAPVSGYESEFFFRYAVSVAGTSNTYNLISNKIEGVRTLAGQTATYSFWAKADTARNIGFDVEQNFGTAGSAQLNTAFSTQWYRNGVAVGAANASAVAIDTTWARYSATVTILGIAGKTINANNYVNIRWNLPSAVIQTIDIWGAQLEAGSILTPFGTNAGNPQAELAACQRYYTKVSVSASSTVFFGYNFTTTEHRTQITLPVNMRTTSPTLTYTTNPTCVFTGAGAWSATASVSMLGNIALIKSTTATATINVLIGLQTNADFSFAAEL